jgi:hypothetical protein
VLGEIAQSLLQRLELAILFARPAQSANSRVAG